MTDPWTAYFEEEARRIEQLFDYARVLAPPPTRAETIVAGWADVRRLWEERSIDDKLLLVHDLGIVPTILYEKVRYGEQFVIEAEGVIVERL